MIDVSAIYGYIGTLKEKPEGDFENYKEQVKTAEIKFRSTLTQLALEDGKALTHFLHEFEDLSETLNDGIKYVKKADKAQREWLEYESIKAKEAATYIKRVQIDFNEESHINEVAADTNDDTIKGVQGLADFLGCGKTKAQSIINSKILLNLKNGTQWEAGGWRFSKSKIQAFINANPTALEKVKCPH